MLTHVNRNPTEWRVAEQYDVSQAAISLTIGRYALPVERALRDRVPTVEGLDQPAQRIADKFLLPCWPSVRPLNT